MCCVTWFARKEAEQSGRGGLILGLVILNFGLLIEATWMSPWGVTLLGQFGWPNFPEIEALRTKFALTSDPAEQKKIADEAQRIGIEEGLYVPLGQMSVPTAYSVKLSGLVHAPIMAFWNVKKAP